MLLISIPLIFVLISTIVDAVHRSSQYCILSITYTCFQIISRRTVNYVLVSLSIPIVIYRHQFDHMQWLRMAMMLAKISVWRIVYAMR